MRSFKRIRVAVYTPLEQVAQDVADDLAGQPDMELIGAGSTPGGALLLAHRSDVLLLNYTLPDDLLGLTIAAVRAVTPARVIVFDAPQDAEALERLYEQGVRGCLSAERTGQELVEVVRQVAHGGIWIEPAVLRSALLRIQHLSEHGRRARAN